jgi:hypothetical protein
MMQATHPARYHLRHGERLQNLTYRREIPLGPDNTYRVILAHISASNERQTLRGGNCHYLPCAAMVNRRSPEVYPMPKAESSQYTSHLNQSPKLIEAILEIP